MVEKYNKYLEGNWADAPVAELLQACEALDLLRHPALGWAAAQLAMQELAEPRLRGQYYQARALANSGQAQQAWQLLADTLDAAKEEVGALEVYIDCLNSLAGMALKMGDPNQSMALATEAFQLAQEANYAKGIAVSCNHFGSMKLQQGDVEGALEYLEEALKQAATSPTLSTNYPVYSNLGIAYMLQGNFAQSLEYFALILDACQQQGHPSGAALTAINLANLYSGQGNYAKALEYALDAAKTFEQLHDTENASYALGLLGDIYKDLAKYTEAEQYYRDALALRTRANDTFGKATAYHHLGTVLGLRGRYDEAAEHLLHARELSEDQGYGSLLAMIYLEMGNLYLLQQRWQDARDALQTGSELTEASGHKHLLHKYLLYSGKLEAERGRPDEALPLLQEAEKMAAQLGLEDDLGKCLQLLSQCYEQLGDTANALAYHKRYFDKEKQLNNEVNTRFIVSLELGHQLDKKTKEAEIERLKHIELKKAYHELKTAQDRLVQQEKLASLGRLVTGIAHELQNPLNFVTNFSSLCVDLAADLEEVVDAEERAELAADLKENLTKINAHSKRASTIVKGMLEFKRDGSGTADGIVLGRIVEEFVPLSWNSYRSRYPEFKVQTVIAPCEKELATHAVGMDVGRAIISIMYNAFDALKEAREKHGPFYTPTINVNMGRAAGKVFVSISDNGVGIAPEHLPIVFDPFFTTKPAGSGNIGLGLSLAHDMIAAQGGSIKVDSRPNVGTTFTIWLPAPVEAETA